MTFVRSIFGAIALLAGSAAAAQAGPTAFTYTDSITQYTIPTSGYYNIDAFGAQGGSAADGFPGGEGANADGEFLLSAGTTLSILAGGTGVAGTGTAGGGGGGGSFVATGHTALVVAGGGGGDGRSGGGGGLSGPNGGNSDGTLGGDGGTGGAGGGWGAPYEYDANEEPLGGAGGGGFSADGGGYYFDGFPLFGTGFVFGGAGVMGITPGPGGGGFGGGGAGGSDYAGGGGGGYSGGGGAGTPGGIYCCGGGGGGSFVAADALASVIMPGANAHQGSVDITFLAPVPEPRSIGLLAAGLAALTLSRRWHRPRPRARAAAAPV